MNQNETVATIKKAQPKAHSSPMQAYQKSNWGKAIPMGKKTRPKSKS